MNAHACFLHDDERDFVTGRRIWRIHLDTRWFALGVALHPASKFARYIDRPSSWIVWNSSIR